MGGAGGTSRFNTLVQGNKLFSLPVLPHWGREGTLGLFPTICFCSVLGGGGACWAAQDGPGHGGSSPSLALLSKDSVSVRSASKAVL